MPQPEILRLPTNPGQPPCHDNPFLREWTGRGSTRWVCHATGCSNRRDGELRWWLLKHAGDLGWI